MLFDDKQYEALNFYLFLFRKTNFMKNFILVLIVFPCLLGCQNENNEIVNIPDANFKKYLIGNEDINTNGDNEIQLSEASSFEGYMDCSEMNISNLKGIEAFTALTQLGLDYNQLTSLDVSKNTALAYLNCGGNKLTSLDVSKNTALDGLDCGENQLTSLDVSKNTALTYLMCSGNSFNCDALKKSRGLE